jgi:hypothetical protein
MVHPSPCGDVEQEEAVGTSQDLDNLRAGFRGILLERVDPSANALRFYYLAWQPSLLDAGAVIRIYGRKHGRRRVLAPLPFASLDEAWPLIRALIRTRLRHGYVMVELNRALDRANNRA